MNKIPFNKGRFFKVKILDNRNLFFIKDVKSKKSMIKGRKGMPRDYDLLKDYGKLKDYERIEENRKCTMALLETLKYGFYGYLGFIFIPPTLYLIGAIAYETVTGNKAPKWSHEVD